MERALAMAPADPYIRLVAVEELYEPQERWDDILEVFRLLPELDPAREFMLEARSLRQSLLETIQESDASNAQIYELYHIADGSTRDFEGRGADATQYDTDYYGRALHRHDPMNDGFDSFGYDHVKHYDRAHDAELLPFLLNKPVPQPMEDIPAVEFYAKLPESLQEHYMNFNWYEIPLMKEWLPETPAAPASETPIDWTTMRDVNGNLTIPRDRVLDEKGALKVSLQQLESLHNVLAAEYETVPALVREGMKAQEHAYELKSHDQLVRDVKMARGEGFADMSIVEPKLKFPVDQTDLAMSPLLKDSLRRFVKDEEEKEEEDPKRKRAW